MLLPLPLSYAKLSIKSEPRCPVPDWQTPSHPTPSLQCFSPSIMYQLDNVCIVIYSCTLWLKTKRNVWLQFLWVRNTAAAQLAAPGSGCSWGCSQDVGWACGYLRAWRGLRCAAKMASSWHVYVGHPRSHSSPHGPLSIWRLTLPRAKDPTDINMKARMPFKPSLRHILLIRSRSLILAHKSGKEN